LSLHDALPIFSRRCTNQRSSVAEDFRIFRVTSGRFSGCTSLTVTTQTCQQQSRLNKERKKNEAADSVQKNTTSAIPDYADPGPNAPGGKRYTIRPARNKQTRDLNS